MTVTIKYGRIPRYRSGGTRKSWGFSISNPTATDMNYGLYTCPRRSAARLYNEKLKPNAEARGFKVRLVLEEGCGLNRKLAPVS